MSDWTGAARSNYVRVKDRAALEAALKPWSIKIVDKNGMIALLADTWDGGWPSWRDREEDEEPGEADIPFEFEDLVVPHLTDGEVLVVVQAGHEKLRYVDGHASAYAWDGRSVHLSLGDIEDLAASTFGLDRKAITEPTY